MAFSLTENAFARLGVSIRARSDKIDEAFEDAVIDAPALEAALLKTKQEITFPKLRVEAEVRWVIDIAPKKTEQILAALKAGDAERTRRFLDEDAAGLSAANIAADACTRFDACVFLPRIIDAHAEITATQVVDEINATRAVSGFGKVSVGQVKDALSNVAKEHAQSIIEALAKLSNPGSTLAEFTAAKSGAFVDVLIEAYDRWASPMLREVEDGVGEVLNSIETSGVGDVEQAIAQLRDWSQISEPVQRHHEARGLDDPRSLKLYYASRAAAISLVNDHQKYDAADQLTSAMSEIFKRLPTAKKQLAIDQEALGELRQDVAREARVRPLRDHVAKLAARMHETARLLETQTWRSDDLAGLDLKVDEARSGGDLDDLALGAVRGLALKLNAENYPRAAYILLHRYFSKLPSVESDLAKRSEDDLAVLRSNADQKDLMRALEQKHFAAAEDMVATLLSYERDEQLRGQLLRIRAQLDKRRSDRSATIIGWVVVGVILAAWFFISQTGQSSRQPEYYPADDYSSASGAAADASADAAAAADAATAQSLHAPSDPYAALDAEPDADPYATPPASLPSPPVNAVTPSAGAGPLYSQNEIESCLEEEAILNRLRNMISSDSAIDRFNARINRYNIRCGAYQYRLDDMTRAQSAISGRSAAVLTEAKRLADEWSYD